MDINIRLMEETDIKAIVEMEKDIFPTPWPEEAFISELRDNKLARYFVGEKDGQVIAYGGLWLIVGEGHITNIGVREDYRGQGIGGKILQALITYCQLTDATAMTLEVRRSNTIAQSLYKKYSFQVAGVRPEYYGDNNEDAIIMWKKFK